MGNFEQYFEHLKEISLLGKVYKKYFASQLLYFQARKFGKNIAEIGSGTGNGILGAYPDNVTGFEINPLAVEFCKKKNFNVHLINENSLCPVQDGQYDVCVLDNVLEHIADPSFILSECARITNKNAGLVVAVPGDKGYLVDDDHKIHYAEHALKNISKDWQLVKVFSMPFMLKSNFLSKSISQYCLVAVYKKM